MAEVERPQQLRQLQVDQGANLGPSLGGKVVEQRAKYSLKAQGEVPGRRGGVGVQDCLGKCPKTSAGVWRDPRSKNWILLVRWYY